MQKLSKLRRLTYDLLENPLRIRLVHHLVDVFLILIIITNVTALILSTLPEWGRRYEQVFTAIEIVTVAIFTFEYVLRVWCCVENRQANITHPLKGRLRYMVRPLSLIDLLAILPFYLQAILPFDLFALRLIRLLRVLKITRFSPALSSLLAVIYGERFNLISSVILMVIFALILSSLMYWIENPVQPEKFASIPHSLWWGIVTLSTVGYGDVVPLTPLGKMLGSVVILTGVGIFALPTAILAAGFLHELQKRNFVTSITIIGKIPAFRKLQTSSLAEIASVIVPQHYPARFVISHRGDYPAAFFIIGKGRVLVNLEKGDVILQEGDCFGERALLENRHERETNITTESETLLLRIEREDFEKLLQKLSDFREAVEKMAAHRQRQKL